MALSAGRPRSGRRAVRTMRSAKAALAGECVTIRMVVPSSLSLSSSFITSSPCSESRLPVGSSARMRFGLMHQRARHGDALLLAARELRPEVVAAVRDVHAFEHRVDSRLALARGRLRVDQRQLDVLVDRELVDEVEALEHEADVAPCGSRRAGSRGSATRPRRESGSCRSLGRVDQPEDVQQRRLAAARGAHDRDELAFVDARSSTASTAVVSTTSVR